MEAKLKGEFKKDISKIDMGSNWPFTVDKGTLIFRDLAIIFKDESNKEYAINGIAIMRKTKKKESKYLDIKPIWAKYKNNTESNISLNPLIMMGLKLNPNYK